MQQSNRCYTCGTSNLFGQYYCMRCGQPLEQWTTAQQVTGMNTKRAEYQYFPCSRCGTPNIVGAPACSNCREQLHYTCPHCNAWVNNTFITCPNCVKPLNWPAQVNPWSMYAADTVYVPGNYEYAMAGQPKKKGVLPALLLVILMTGLLVVGLDLLTNNSNSLASNQAAASAAPVSSTPQIQGTSSSTQAPVSAITLSPAPNTTPTPAAALTSTYTATQGNVYEFSLPATIVNSASNTSSGSTYTPASSTYLQQLVPGWGHCSGGSCRQTTGY